MAKLTTAQRKAMPKGKFALPAKKNSKNKTGKGAYPMPDKKHAAVAKGFAARFASPADKEKIDAKANKVLGKGKKQSYVKNPTAF